MNFFGHMNFFYDPIMIYINIFFKYSIIVFDLIIISNDSNYWISMNNNMIIVGIQHALQIAPIFPFIWVFADNILRRLFFRSPDIFYLHCAEPPHSVCGWFNLVLATNSFPIARISIQEMTLLQMQFFFEVRGR